MKIPFFSSRHWKVLVSLSLIVIILISLEVWTVSAPPILTPQSETSLNETSVSVRGDQEHSEYNRWRRFVFVSFRTGLQRVS